MTSMFQPQVLFLILQLSGASSKLRYPLRSIDDLKVVVHKFFDFPVEEKKSLKENSPPKVFSLTTSFNPILSWF